MKSHVHLLLILATSCGSASTPVQAFHSRSQVRLALPPDASEINARIRPYWDFDENAASITARGYRDEVTITFAGEERVLVVRPWFTTPNSTPQYWLVGCVDSSGRFTLYKIPIELQTDGDVVPNLASKVPLFDSGTTPMYITEIERIPNTNSVFMLDRRCQDVLVATDTNGSGFPDTIAPQPFAEAAQFTSLLDVQILVPHSRTELRAIRGNSPFDYITQRKLRETYAGRYETFVDTDADNMADATSQIQLPNRAPLLWVKKLETSQTVIKLLGEPGRSVEIWKLDSSFDDDVQLATFTLTGQWDDVALSDPLAWGDAVRIGYAGQMATALQRTAVAIQPQLHAATPHSVDVTGSTIRVTAVNLPTKLSGRLRYGGLGLSYPLETFVTVSVSSSESASVLLPALPASAEGGAIVELFDNADPSTTLIQFHVTLRTNEN